MFNFRLTYINEKGITLLELIVAMAIMGMILLILSSTLSLAVKSIDRGELKIETIERLRSSLRLINAQVQSALVEAKNLDAPAFNPNPDDNIVPSDSDDEDESVDGFSGDDKSLSFKSLVSVWGRSRGAVSVNYSVKEGADGTTALYVSEQNDTAGSSDEIKLFDQFDSIEFSYYVVDELLIDQKGEWQDSFNEGNSISEDLQLGSKSLAKIALNLKQGDREIEYIIPVRVKSGLGP
jgi:prepilin-type N-terminal cleavage/methylation domain-containing protein